MKRNIRSWVWPLLCAAALLLSLAACGGDQTGQGEQPTKGPQQSQGSTGDIGERTVASIEVAKLPDKTAYVIGDTFSPQGGTIKVNYDDGSSDEIEMTDSGVELSQPKMNTANTKNVTVSYGGKKVTFKIEVAGAMCGVTFAPNYDGASAAEAVQVSKGSAVTEPAFPVREGYTFQGWYIDTDFTSRYDFSVPVEDDITLYALWTRDGAEYVNVTFDYDYYGVTLSAYSYPVEKGTAVARPAADPTRVGYAFAGWVDETGSAYDFAAPLASDTTVKAAWTKTASKEIYVFEAEDTDLTGKIGPSYSGTAQEESMIIFNDSIGASNDRVVGYMCQKDNTLEFYIASDADVSDATLTVRVTGEYITMSYDGNDFQVLVNGSSKSYSTVTVEADQSGLAQCDDRIVIDSVALKKGENLIQLKTNNTNAVSGTTFTSNAPIIDCIKLETSAVLIWDENHGVPALDNYQH
ncbi:InlB B-repeat-containing protein [Lawsonibacter faecis]|jgi:putative conserved repeat protein|uniref:InlB B-repeat-containing protein n=1 Tax=Lawsonibacter faecis TaxID=2763052 RepID=A0A8J6JLG8_9FIRM|nr:MULTISPECIES: InlB B-repeat-containing protein [Oscillospiraceae]MTQ98239.1 hypothetical protein [Pseudoflavonifractor sp. BIOML-A16]MTR06826.1 hypothetical protein [Pseudoflavonifractor sp. BIOML-A15]MTR31812.1 hypothetical protein [Pseudoflavonifractor sp. BIOML-A14]MTR73567.1 hypothetical protein [Pseudoflavonifractor sp. BIOML-A18]MTS64850.1 hypothetical protein [Pseudoflavonifractor sp. BIOML-A5]MTS72455.1 hypothetical protein [Pseudoflavonifractor sp. BIOML-A8]MTS90719.1 hypothetica